ncbi:pirin family protein [Achromobacter sp. Marseille-Q0513]|uniref:pirin family protein n=1 Tax=Achromobacter sp. Marseille-Q0513 TaxID=2829161 RepID=UPI001B9F402E|nr:pirin family protein [Achromobacter sp. Marseille-Q0513]MBR8653942.1 pirin family protein [Achromobacter sp. Marseille-Q0513]
MDTTTLSPQTSARPATRAIVHRTAGRGHGPITRLMSPSDLGELAKPFVFLDHFDDPSMRPAAMPLHPHSGIATLTYLMEGSIRYEDSTGAAGVLPPGSVEWMMAGGGVWHGGGAAAQGRVRGFQLWVAMPPALEHAPALSRYIGPESVPSVGPARVLLGQYQGVEGAAPAPSPMTYLAVRLQAGERWRYQPPPAHTVAWLAVSTGRLLAPGAIDAGEMAMFEDSGRAIELHASQDAEFVIGSAVKHPHPLVLGNYSVHTSPAALRRGEDGIRQIDAGLGQRRRVRF